MNIGGADQDMDWAEAAVTEGPADVAVSPVISQTSGSSKFIDYGCTLETTPKSFHHLVI